MGHEVRAAEDGRRLVELCGEFEPDLAVTDYAIPGLDGLAAAAEINRGRRSYIVTRLPPKPNLPASVRHSRSSSGRPVRARRVPQRDFGAATLPIRRSCATQGRWLATCPRGRRQAASRWRPTGSILGGAGRQSR
jgi:hypothetical protein